MGAKCCRRKQDGAPAGSVLDQVISQASDDDQTILYKIANYKKGGLLLETYARGGQSAAEQLIREQFASYMYASGRGQLINRAEYLRWKFRDHDHVVLPIEASLSRHDPLARWSDHEACWQMRYRGVLGESLLHLLIICDTKIHTRLARTLLKCFPRLSLDVVEGEEYLGASSLHLAIAYSNNELVQDLVEAGANVVQRAIGSFFLPRDQQRSPPARHTDYEGLAYLGEYPLAWAACCANESVYNLLVDSGADPDLPDSFGNMTLHMVVVCDKLDMFGYALRHPKLPASNGKVNAAGLTPLTLACQLGRAEVFREMLELSAREFWRYSNITCSAYPLNALDTLLPDGRTNWNSALFIILNGTKEAHLDMLDGGIIQRLLEEKWKTFARNQFLKRLLILFVHLVLVSAAVYLRPARGPLLGAAAGVRDVMRYACELAALAGVLSYVLLQQGEELKNQGLVAFVKQLGNAPAKAIFLLSNFLILACIPCRLTGNKRAEEAILVFAVPGSWFLLMFFAGAVRLTGPFVTMIYSMITGDMLTFGIIYSIVLFGFSQSFFFLYKGFPNVKSSLYATYPSTWMALFQITLGDYTYSDLGMTTYPTLAKTVFALFMVFVPILLLNMLIAMMGNTYAHVIEQSEKEWMKQWAKIVVTLERAVPQADAHRYLQEYSIGLGPGDQPRMEQRAVMVIKSKAKTRAKQRKGAVSNWKRVGKVTITELRRRGMTGEDLRRLMWGRASISTPTKIPIKPATDALQPADSHNIAGGFGSALVSALDVMAFTHDLDLSTASTGLTLQSAVKVTTAPTTATSTTGAVTTSAARAGSAAAHVNAGGSIMGMLNQISDSQVPAISGAATHLTGSVGPQLATGQMPPFSVGQVPQFGPGHAPQFAAGQAGQFAAGQMQQFGAATTVGTQSVGGFLPQFGAGTVTQIAGANVPPAPGFAVPTPAAGFIVPTPAPGFVLATQAGVGVPQFGTAVPGIAAAGPTFVTAPGFIANAAATPAMVCAAQQQQHRDWLRELVLLSEGAAAEGAGDALLRQLAAEAANLDHVTEVTIIKKPAAARSARCAVAGAMSGLFGVEARNAAALSWTQQRAAARLEPSDSEGLGETPLLGRLSRTRRARSATRRRAPPAEPAAGYRPERAAFLLALGDTDSGDATGPSRQDADLEYAALRFRQLRGDAGSAAAEGGASGLDLKDVRPLVIQQAAMTAAMETIAENALIFKGEGAGVEVEDANQPTEAWPAADRKKHDRKRKPRPKTAKINRVSPMEVRRGRSAGARHPLRHWSVAALAPMSRLLRSEPSASDETP